MVQAESPETHLQLDLEDLGLVKMPVLADSAPSLIQVMHPPVCGTTRVFLSKATGSVSAEEEAEVD